MKYLESVSTVLSFIELHLREPISVAKICEQAEISSFHFQRVFREYTGESIGSYLRRRRLACAADELKNSELRVIDIAMEFQFGSSEAFSRAFKTEFSVSPANFREAPTRIQPYKKPELKSENLTYISSEMDLFPEIKIIDPLLLAGLRVSLVSPLIRSHEYMEEVDRTWKRYLEHETQITNLIGGIKVGVIAGISRQQHPHEDMIDYLACGPVASRGEFPNGFESFLIPGGKYAIFHAQGFHKQTQYMIDYVYSTWLPKSEHTRADGAEFTWLDHRVEPLSNLSSRVDYYLPIR